MLGNLPGPGRPTNLDYSRVSELGFNVPPTTRSYGDGTSV